MHTQLEAIGEQAEDYKQMQDTFHISQYEFTQLRDTISQYKLKIEIWSKLDTWNKSMKEWKSADFLGLALDIVRNYMKSSAAGAAKKKDAPASPSKPKRSAKAS